LGLFDQAEASQVETEESAQPDPVQQRMAEIDPDSLTPLEALALLYELKEL
jgi:DNA mismatch repair ATPase MutS